MKKALSIVLAALMLICMTAIPVLASEDTAPTAYVTIVDENGEFVLVEKEVPCADQNGDTVVTIDEMLRNAHHLHYKGGAEAGYASEETAYGLSLTKLWGNESGSYGYYVNNASAWSLADEVKPSDHIYAFVYTDTATWSDTYCFFNKTHVTAEKGEIATLTLKMAGYDENYAPISLPVEGAVITINGEKTDLVTDANGEVAITYDKAGELLISAEHDELNLTPPVLVATVEGGVNYALIAVIVAIVLVIAVAVVVIVRKKR
jgi:hypothetical protein